MGATDSLSTPPAGRRPLAVLVTGGNGFLGRHIVRRLLERGDRVRVFARHAPDDLVRAGAECVRGDLVRPEKVVAACEGMDAVVHTAAKAGIWGPYRDYHAANVLGTLHVIGGCQAHGVRRLVHTSSFSVVYGRHAIDGDEGADYPKRYLAHYPATKAAAERAVLAANGPELATCVLRPHLVYGPGDSHILPSLLERARTGCLRRIGAGRNRIAMSYVENVADAHLAALDALVDPDHPIAGHAYGIADADPVNCWDWINRFLQAMDLPPVTRGVPLWLAYYAGALCEAWGRLTRASADPTLTRFLAMQLGTDHWFRPDAIRRDLGWTPPVPPDEAWRRTIDFLRAPPPDPADTNSAPEPERPAVVATPAPVAPVAPVGREAVATPDAPAAVGPYAQAVRAGDFLFVSGQLPLRPEDGTLLDGDIGRATAQACENVGALLRAAGLDFTHVVKTTVFLRDMNDFAAMNDVYAGYFGALPPARACVQPAKLPRNASVEIEAIAFFPRGDRP